MITTILGGGSFSWPGVVPIDLPGVRVASLAWPMVSYSTFPLRIYFNHVTVVGRPDLTASVAGSWRRTHPHLSGEFALTENELNCKCKFN